MAAMDGFTQTLILATVVLGCAAAAVGVYSATQRVYQGYAWWSSALWLNTAAMALLAALGDLPQLLPAAQLVFIAWPVLALVGLRRFHARIVWSGSEARDFMVLGAVLVAALLATVAATGTATTWVPLIGSAATLVYTGALLWRAGRDRADRADRVLRGLGLLWWGAALASLLAPVLGHGARQVAQLQAAGVAVASLVMAFVALLLCAQRAERELRDSRRRLRVLANIDMLTQVPNRRRFEQLARRALQSDAPGSATLLLVDIDHFKQINDAYGHAAGDRALKLVSRCTLELLRADDVAGRQGGDEFVLLLRHSTPENAMLVAERLVAQLQTRASAHALPPLSLSFGIVQMRAGEPIEQTVQRADAALYEAKRLGRSRAVAAAGDDERTVFRSSRPLGLTAM
jgi:diguanylate cyclase (GGDEF)-like protein